ATGRGGMGREEGQPQDPGDRREQRFRDLEVEPDPGGGQRRAAESEEEVQEDEPREREAEGPAQGQQSFHARSEHCTRQCPAARWIRRSTARRDYNGSQEREEV